MADWQNYLVAGMIGWAILYMSRRVWLLGINYFTGHCGGCSGCSADSTDQKSTCTSQKSNPLPSNLVQLENDTKS